MTKSEKTKSIHKTLLFIEIPDSPCPYLISTHTVTHKAKENNVLSFIFYIFDLE